MTTIQIEADKVIAVLRKSCHSACEIAALFIEQLIDENQSLHHELLSLRHDKKNDPFGEAA